MHKDEASWCPFPAKLPPESGDYLVVLRNCQVKYTHYDADERVFGLVQREDVYLVDSWLRVPPAPTPPWLDFCDDVVNSGRVDADLGCECGALPSSMGKNLRTQGPILHCWDGTIGREGLPSYLCTLREDEDYVPCGGVEKDE